VVSVALSRDAKMLASSSLDSAIHIWDTNTGLSTTCLKNFQTKSQILVFYTPRFQLKFNLNIPESGILTDLFV
jgi:hypothetical protein